MLYNIVYFLTVKELCKKENINYNTIGSIYYFPAREVFTV